jgi:hypothetical protein
LKWVFLLFLAVMTPALAAYLKGNRRHLPIAAFALGVLPFLELKLNLSADPYSWPAWQGMTKGFEISLMDGIAVAVIFATRKARAEWPLQVALAIT